MTDFVLEPSPQPAVAEDKAFQQEVAGQIRRSPAHELPKVPGVGSPLPEYRLHRCKKLISLLQLFGFGFWRRGLRFQGSDEGL